MAELSEDIEVLAASMLPLGKNVHTVSDKLPSRVMKSIRRLPSAAHLESFSNSNMGSNVAKAVRAVRVEHTGHDHQSTPCNQRLYDCESISDIAVTGILLRPFCLRPLGDIHRADRTGEQRRCSAS